MSLLDYDEDLSVNEFFVHLKTEYTSIFKDASTKRYTVSGTKNCPLGISFIIVLRGILHGILHL